MRVRASVTCSVVLNSFVCFCVGAVTAFSEEPIAQNPSAKLIELETHGKDYLQLLSGPAGLCHHESWAGGPGVS
jgi:hypothetical protein